MASSSLISPTDSARTFALDFGASSSLTNGRITLTLNVALADFDRIYLHAVHQRNGNSADLRIRVVNGGAWRPADSFVAGPVTAGYPSDALYVLVPLAATSQVVTYGTPVCWIHQQPGHQQGRVDQLTVEVTDWRGNAVTYDELQLLLFATRKNVEKRMLGDDPRLLRGANELRGGGFV